MTHHKQDEGPLCEYCGAQDAPGGDARNMWISYHDWWLHRLYWTIKKKASKR